MKENSLRRNQWEGERGKKRILRGERGLKYAICMCLKTV
jgi:hypothetical protein